MDRGRIDRGLGGWIYLEPLYRDRQAIRIKWIRIWRQGCFETSGRGGLAVTSLIEFLAMVLVLTLLFSVVIGLPVLVWRLWRRRRFSAGGIEAPLIGSLVGCKIADPETGKPIDVVGILRGYGFFNEGRAVYKYLENVRTEDGREIGEVVDLKGQGVTDWIRSVRVTSRDDLMRRLGLTTPTHVGLSAVGRWRDERFTWRRKEW